MSFPEFIKVKMVKERSDLILEGVIESSTYSVFPNMKREVISQYWLFQNTPTVVHSNKIGVTIYDKLPQIGFWTLPGDKIPEVGKHIRVALTVFGNPSESEVFYAIDLWELDENNMIKKVPKDLTLAEGCTPYSSILSDDVILYGVRDAYIGEQYYELIESCLNAWNNHLFGKRLQIVTLTPPDYKEEHHYEIYSVDQIPGNPLARTLFPGSIKNPKPIWFNSKYEFVTDPYGNEDKDKYYFQSVLTHELGHSLCLHHICDKEHAVMYPTIPPISLRPKPDPPQFPWNKTWLEDPDIAILREKYPLRDR